MMTSSGLGPYRVGSLGSLSSSSNLSPLAAPFRVDKSLQNQNSTNTSMSYPDMPMYGPYFDPAGQLWNHSSSSATGSNFAETESMGINTTCSPPAIYGYSGSQPIADVAGIYHDASNVAAAYNPFSYDPFRNPISTASEEDVNSYYSPYVSPPPQKDGYLSLGVSSGHGFDLLSNSSTAHLDVCGSSASGGLQGRSVDGDNKLHWGGFWSGVNGQEKWLENAQGFGSKDSNQSDLLSGKSPFPVDGINKSQPSVVVHTHPFLDGTSNNNIPDGGNMSSLKQDGCFDIFGGAYYLGNLGIDQQDGRSLSDCSRLLTSVSSLKTKESSHLEDPVVQSVTNFCGSQKENVLSLGDHFSKNDFYVFGCTSTTSTYPIIKNKSPFGESSSSAGRTFSAIKPNPKISVEANRSNISVRHDYSYPIEPHMPLGLKRQSRIVIRRPSSSSVMPSSSFNQIGESLDNRIVAEDVYEEDQVSPEMPHQISSDGLGMEVNDAQAAYSVEKLSGASDVHNPAEDSPCWKGASLNRFSTIEVTKAMDPDVFAKKLDEWKSLNTQASQIKSCLADTSDCRDLFSEKAKEGNLSEKPLVPECTSKDNKERCYAIQQPFFFDLNAGDGLQFGDEGFVSTKECHILNKSETDLLPGITLGATQISGEMEILSPSPMSEAAASEGSGKFQPVMGNYSFDGPSSSEKDHAISPPGDTASLKHSQATSKISDTNIDVNMLLKAMTNLSEIFRSYCFSKRASVPEQHSIAIKRVIANLNASMLMMAGETSSTMPSSEVNSSKNDISDAQKVTGAAFEALAAAVKLGGTAEGLLDSVSCKDSPNTDGDGDITEALKKILHENFRVEEEMDQQKLLYKNLWLDAEASLCAMTANARFLRVKAEMERPHDGAKDGEIPLSFKNCGDVHRMVELATCCKDPSVLSNHQKTCAISESNRAEEPEVNKCPIPNTQVVTMNSLESEVQNHSLSLHASKRGNTGNDSDGSGSTSHDNDAEASVMARYQILKSRIESSEATSQESKESSDRHKDPSSFGDAMGADNPVSTKYQTLNCRVNHESLNERNSLPGEDNYLPDRESSSPIYQILESGADNSDPLYKVRDSQNSQMLSNSVGVPEVGEASVITRFRIIQSRVSHSDTVDNGQIPAPPVKVLEDGTDELGLFLGKTLGPYPEFTEDEDEDILQFHVPVHGEVYLNPNCNSNRLNGEVLESWFDNKCSSSDWEHVSKEDLRRPN